MEKYSEGTRSVELNYRSSMRNPLSCKMGHYLVKPLPLREHSFRRAGGGPEESL